MPSPAPLDPDRACPHFNFNAVTAVNRITRCEGGPVEGYYADITIVCADCGEAFQWIGLPAGLRPDQPCVSVDGLELRAPLRPASAEERFGLDLAGFSIEVFSDAAE
jgi:hypothetical protein